MKPNNIHEDMFREVILYSCKERPSRIVFNTNSAMYAYQPYIEIIVAYRDWAMTIKVDALFYILFGKASSKEMAEVLIDLKKAIREEEKLRERLIFSNTHIGDLL